MVLILLYILLRSILLIYRRQIAMGFCWMFAAGLTAFVIYREHQVRIYFYDAEILTRGKGLLESCAPKGGVPIDKSNVRICKFYDLGADDVDIIVLIQGVTPPETVIADVAKRGTPAMVDSVKVLGYGWGQSGYDAHKLLSNYYVIHDHLGFSDVIGLP
jgi:hypothetical protein